MAVWYHGGGLYTTTSSSTTGITTYAPTGTASGGWTTDTTTLVPPSMVVREGPVTQGVIEPSGHLEIYLKDGTHIVVDQDQNVRVRDKDAKVVYKANRVREFNRYVNASDLIEEFIRDLGAHGVTQREVLDTPINVFITWLIYRASLQDGDAAEKPRLRHQPQCRCCGKFIPKALAAAGFEFCSPAHANQQYQRVVHDQNQRRLGSGEGRARVAGSPVAGRSEPAHQGEGADQGHLLLSDN